MQSLKELYKVGPGPSSSHTIAPHRACKLFVEEFGPYPYYEAELFGSLSLTGKGHHTDAIIINSLPGHTEVKFSLDWEEEFPNGFYLTAFDDDHVEQHKWTIFSVGGGSIRIKEKHLEWNDDLYTEKNWKEVYDRLQRENITLPQYVYSYEPDLKYFLSEIVDAEIDAVKRGLNAEGHLPGKLALLRSAKALYEQSRICGAAERDTVRLMAYAYAACEESADGHMSVTGPTLGSCGIIAAMVYYYIKDRDFPREQVVDALAVGGVFGNVIKTNATISGAVGGCQAEVGAAVSMAAAAIAYLEGESIEQIEYAAEIGMEHNLGLTCDPVLGYVMIPCIERNGMGILRARDAALLSRHMSKIKDHVITFDMVVHTMNETGEMIPIELKETSEGGLAKEYLSVYDVDSH
ncbi:MAG: L-serine ammonia-lyase, iron-sulfur-dependent, subunit alpha [Solobacterium sp.]|nr:L-serine ammonia-lyase, iron-sulfur-dependent, subunit alpha [Solobacterium sp.]